MDRGIEKPEGCRYYQVHFDHMIIALCPSIETAQTVLYSLTFYAEHMRPVKELLKDFLEK